MKDKVVKILLVDDDEDDYVLTRELFSLVKTGEYLIDWASTYEEGFRLAQRLEHDVCLVDFSLGERSGVEFIKDCREARLATPLILLTGWGDRAVDLAAMKAGATDYLVKDETSPSRLERTIRYAVELNLERSRGEARLEQYAQKHAAAAEIGRLALTGGNLNGLFDEVVAAVARTLDVEFSKILELLPQGDKLLLKAGVGWNEEYQVGYATVGANKESHAGFTLLSNEPVVVEDLIEETRFSGSQLLLDHRVRSSLSVIIRGSSGNSHYGVLGAHTASLREFSVDDANFLRSVANVLAEAIVRSQAEEELKKSESRFRHVVESNVFGIFFSDPSGKISDANDAFLEMVGYDRSELMAGHLNWSHMSPPEYAAADAKAIEEITTLGVCDTYEKEFIRKDGSRLPSLINVATFEGTAQGGVAFVLDNTERKKVQESLKQSQAWLDAIFAASRDGIVVEENDRIVYANSALADLYGYGSQAEVIGKHVSDFRAGDDDQRLLNFTRQRVAGKDAPTMYEFKGLRKDSSVFDVEASVSSFQSEGKIFIVSALRDITERKRSEAALKQSELRYHSLFENMLEGYAYCQTLFEQGELTDFIYLEVNDAFAKLTGLQNVVGRKVSEVVPEFRESSRELLEIFSRVALTGQSEKSETYLGRLGIWISVTVYSSEKEHFVVVFDNITTRKQAENALRQSDEKFHQLADNITDVFWIRSADMRELHYVSPAFERIWGRSVASLAASPLAWSDFIVPEDRERVQAAFAELTRDVPDLDIEYRITRPNGEVRWVRARGFQVRDTTGQVIRNTGIVTDITERKHTEVERAGLLLQLEAEQARLVDIFTNAPAFIASLRGPDHVFELANSGYYDLVGDRQVVGRKVRDVFPDLEGQGFLELLDNVYETGVPFVGNEMPVELDSRNGTHRDLRYINFVYHPLRDLEGQVSGIICHGVDITEQVLSRRRLEDSENQLRQSQKLESVGLLAGGIAHDFNNLLTVITGYSDLTLKHLNEVDPLAGHVGEIKKAADKAALLTRQLLAFSRKQVLQPKVIDLNAIVLDIGKLIQRLLGENVELHISPGVELGRVKADPGQIQQVILNLAINARDSFSGDGKVTIETANVLLDEEYAQAHVSVRPGWHVMLSVSDTGQGMDDETQKHIFEPFFTTKEQGKGTGLGLAMVYGIVKQSGGSIWVFSEVGKGTTFRIYLPLVDEQLKEIEKDTDRPQSSEGIETILLAEDDEMVRNLTRESLKMSGYAVLEAPNGREALVVSERFKGPIHLLLTDVVMPGMSGRELAEKFLKVRPRTRVLYMSGYTDQALGPEGVLGDEIAFLQKPFTPDSLALKVAEVLQLDLGHGHL